MKLLVDIGNSRVKWAVMSTGPIKSQSFVRSKTGIKASLNKHWTTLKDIKAIYVANVAGDHIAKDLTQWCEKHWSVTPIFIQSEQKKFGVTNAYDKPDTLGVDRWLALIAARQHARQASCIIDCGTAITIDLITKQGLHQGGMIIPGLSLMQQSLVKGTFQLNNTGIIAEEGFRILATNTENAIQAGTLYAVIATLEHIIDDLKKQLDNHIRFILTGGDAEKLKSLLSFSISYYPDLVLKGLAYYARQHDKRNKSNRNNIKKQEEEKSGLPDDAN